jgi:hypothetical protein
MLGRSYSHQNKEKVVNTVVFHFNSQKYWRKQRGMQGFGGETWEIETAWKTQAKMRE